MVALPLYRWHLRWKLRQQFPWTVLYAMMVSGMADSHPDHFFPSIMLAGTSPRGLSLMPAAEASYRGIVESITHSVHSYVNIYLALDNSSRSTSIEDAFLLGNFGWNGTTTCTVRKLFSTSSWVHCQRTRRQENRNSPRFSTGMSSPRSLLRSRLTEFNQPSLRSTTLHHS